MAVKLTDEERQLWKHRIVSGLAYRRRSGVEEIWREVLAFRKGYHWVKWVGQGSTRQLVTVPNPRNLERYEVDELTQFALTLHGELSLDDDRPQALFRQNDAPTEDYTQQANDAIAYGWDEEFAADEALSEARRVEIDMGTAPVRCLYDPTAGDEIPEEQPFVDGALVSVEQAMEAHRLGKKVELRRIREGRIRWEAGTPFNVIPPPRIHREDKFPWEVWVSVADLQATKDQYPDAAGELTSDPVQSVATLSQPDDPNSSPYEQDGSEPAGVLDGQCFIYTCYQRPTRKNPKGRMVTLGSGRFVPLEARDELPYRGPDGTYRSGIHYLHAIRLTDRFWSRGFMELGLSPQRVINKRTTQIEHTINMGQPMRWVEEGSIKKIPEGWPGEIGWLKAGKPKPQTDPGMAPGAHMYQSIEAARENLSRAVLPEVSLGENPTNVDTYSALALLNETAKRRLDGIIAQNKAEIIHLVEDSAWDIKRYWGAEKQIQIGGDEGGLRAATFNASQWPDYYRFQFAKGASLPRSQGAQVKLIETIWAGALASRASLSDPLAWIDWLYRSLQAGKPLDLPVPPVDAQREKAQYENEILTQGLSPEDAVALVDYFDTHELHIVEHRQIQSHARLMGRADVFVSCEAHIKEHERQAILNVMESAQSMPQQEAPMNGDAPVAPASVA